MNKFLNRLKSIYNFRSSSSNINSYPQEIIVEITNHCNLACPMCSRVNMERSVGFMTIELFKKIIDESKDYAEIVHFAGGLGDPMLHPKFEQFINYAKINNVKVGLSTNATMLSDKNISKLIKDSPDVMFLSLDGFTKETHEKIRVGSNFEKTIKGVENYLKAKVENNLQTYVVSQMVYMPINSDEAEKFKKKWSNNPGINDVRLKKFLSFAGAPYQPDKNSKKNYSSCILPWRQLSVSYNGFVGICCRDYNYDDKAGDLNHESIKEIWNSEKMINNRKLLSSNNKENIKSCKDCGTIKTNLFTQTGLIALDAFRLRKMLPHFEKFLLKFKIPIDYD